MSDDRADLFKLTVEGPKQIERALGKLAGDVPPPPSPPAAVERSGSVTLVGGEAVRYTARAGTMRLKPEHGDSEADIFHVSYLADGADAATRPITFCFNGGPGSSTVWLHMGAFGPKRVALDDFGSALSAGAQLIDNDCSLLDVTDLVFVDPVSTGFSRAVPKGEDRAFHGVDSDLVACGRFIRRYLDQHGRWASPKYLAGESYGSLRVAGLAGRLQEKDGCYLDGVILVSAVLDLKTLVFGPTNDLPYQLYLPAYCAVAQHHGRLPEALQGQPTADLLAMAEKFANGPLAFALFQGSQLAQGKRRELIAEYARLTGLRPEVVDRHDLRIDVPTFVEELLIEDKRVVGRLDGRYVGDERWASALAYLRDPSFLGIQGAYTAQLNDYVRRELGYVSDAAYEIFTDRIERWDPGEAFAGSYVQTASHLRGALLQNPHLRVHVAAGYTDLATPYTAIQYTMSHLGQPVSLTDRIRISYYHAGHMMYVHRPSHLHLREELVAFYASR